MLRNRIAGSALSTMKLVVNGRGLPRKGNVMTSGIKTGMFLALLSVAVVTGTGCTSERERRMEDARLAERVMDELRDERDLDVSRVSVQAKGHLVQLSGFVDTDAEKERAERVAEDVKGVKDVENDLIVD